MTYAPNDLLTATEVAELLGLKHRQAVSTYRGRYPTFPAPVLNKGTCVLWARADIQEWAASRHAS